jgi:pimeloyl-ACP methyl ester carboxylesterase
MAGDFLLSLRRDDHSGVSRSRVLEEVRPESGMTTLIYVHGFNVDRDRALEQWDTLRTLLPVVGNLQGGCLLWPSDLDHSRMLARPLYPAVIEPAERAGRVLGEYLLDHSSNDYVLVGHSLGALLVLEAAGRFRQKSPADSRIAGLALLGAAVKVSDMEEPAGPFGLGLAWREAVGFSPHDDVLKRPFRAGARMAEPFTPPSEAVGLRGKPHERDWIRQNFRIHHHSHWEERKAGQLIGRVLGPAGGSRPDEAAPAPEWVTPAQGSPASR